MYYLYVYNSSDADEFYLVESSLGAVLTARLLIHASHADEGRVYGFVEDVNWFGTDKPKRVVALNFFVEPRIFTEDKSGKYWALLSSQDAEALHKYWRSLYAYSEVPADNKQNYFKNTVDNFKDRMNSKWFKQVK